MSRGTPRALKCGEIRLAATALKALFGRKDFQLLADDGRLFHFRFSDTKHVIGELPTTPRNWRN